MRCARLAAPQCCAASGAPALRPANGAPAPCLSGRRAGYTRLHFRWTCGAAAL